MSLSLGCALACEPGAAPDPSATSDAPATTTVSTTSTASTGATPAPSRDPVVFTRGAESLDGSPSGTAEHTRMTERTR